ncbi:ATP-binding protein, partial [Streptomyces triticagri]
MIDYLQSQDLVFWLLVLVIPVLVVVALRERSVARTHRRRSARALDQRRERDAALRWLAETYLRQIENPNEDPGPFSLPNDALAGTEFEQTLAVVAQRFHGSTIDARDRADAAVRTALQAVTSGFLSRTLSQQRSIESMERRFDNPQVLESLMEINHQNAGLGNWARTIAVICGGTVGRQREPVTLTDVARAAAGEIHDYKRVQVRSMLDVSVLSHAVNPVVLAVAALLDNAARYSRPEHEIEVNLRTVPNGALVVIDDYGIGMGEAERRRAVELLAGTSQIEIASLGSTPQFGFRVVGLLAHRFGFTVNVDHSPYGGVRAVILLPHSLLTSQAGADTPPAEETGQAPVPRPRAGEPAIAPPVPGQGGVRHVPRQPLDPSVPPPSAPAAREPERPRAVPPPAVAEPGGHRSAPPPAAADPAGPGSVPP